ncbi:Ribosome biogenesis protein brx1 [Metarhizium acridum]|uniref:Brix domain-containing protein 2 n=1 Tax=Metarhizium acridum (strain CQMa 102) TaxID=655827 RepID=E9DR04_METAQ|nr:brix domain-containing protein 2 [Metarhizium acridum CQMa 102]EFY93682.1 brix domain-containing protein 2 [Metarhizium acridum CQMa 102]KAG8404912.1 Ribosome biogenesis protein brx1 [Metarhizium acridum]KAG8408351.1 Ribosome biogenesis protein brx1 [Metarhizium acridum]
MASVYKTLSTDTRAKSGAEDGSPKAKPKNAQRVLLLSSRGINARHRHLLNDLAALLPHSRRESKFDSKKNLHDLNELADLYNCNNVLFLEARKRQDLYMHISKAPNGPRARFHVQNLHTMSELNFMGNSLKGSRPILSFDAAFNGEPYLRLLRELLTHTFGVPPTARKAKPFIDRVLAFIVADGRIWVRHYQIVEEEDDASKDEKLSLREIGPRFCLTPMFIQEGSFGGPIIYENKQFVSPNQVRADLRRRDSARHNARKAQAVTHFAKKDNLGIRTGSGSLRRNALDPRELFT